MLLIPFDHLIKKPGDRLVLSEAANPYIHALQRPLQGFIFPEIAAKLTVLNTLIEKIDPPFLYHFLNLLIIREKYLYGHAIFLIGMLNQIIGLLIEATSIQSKNTCLTVNSCNHIGDHLVFNTHARCLNYLTLVLLQEIPQYLLWAHTLHLEVQIFNQLLRHICQMNCENKDLQVLFKIILSQPV